MPTELKCQPVFVNLLLIFPMSNIISQLFIFLRACVNKPAKKTAGYFIYLLSHLLHTHRGAQFANIKIVYTCTA